MDDYEEEPRIIMRQHPDCTDARSSLYGDSRISRSISVYNDPRMSKIMLRNDAKLARSISVNDPRMRESIIMEELKPLQKNVKLIKPVNHRRHSCTDVPCLIIFACFIAAWIYVANYALIYGDLDKVLIPVDSNNAKCGLDSGVLDKKMLFFFNLDKCLNPLLPITGCDSRQVCVEKCPKNSFSFDQHLKNLTAMKENLICEDNLDKNKLNDLNAVEKAIEDNRCSGWYMKSKPLFNHCIWDFSNACSFLGKSDKNRKRRELENYVNSTAVWEKLGDFFNTTQSWCTQQSQSVALQTSDVAQQNQPVAQQNQAVAQRNETPKSDSMFERIVAAIISKYGYSSIPNLSDDIIDDLKNSYKVILGAFIIHLIVVLMFITLLRWIAGPLVWISIVGVLTGLSVSLYFCIEEYKVLVNEPHVPKHSTNVKATVQNILQNPEFWFYLSIVVGAILLIISLILIVIRKRIKIAIAIVKEASKAITCIKSSIFFPIFPGILYLIVAILAGIIMLYLSSIGEFTFKMVRQNSTEKSSEECICDGPLPTKYSLGDSCNPKLFEHFCHLANNKAAACLETSCSFNEMVRDKQTQWFMLFNVFGYLWVTFFISAYEDMVLACTFSIWYWTFNKKDIPKLPLLKAMWITTIYHLGTLAFGSLILSICRMIRYMLELIEKKAKMYQNALTRAIMCCMKCFFWLLEKFLRFLNRNAYITCAIHSTNFCSSSKKAFVLITQNILRVYAVDKVSIFLFFLSKILVTGCTSCATYYFLTIYRNGSFVHYPFVPVALVAVCSYVMAHVVFSTYSMAVDTLFFCFLEDSTENDGSIEKPFYMSKQLRKLLGKKQKKQIRNDYILDH